MATAASGTPGTMHSAILMVLSDRFKQCFEILDEDNKDVWVDCKEVLEHAGYNADVADRVKAVVGKALRKAFGDALRWKKFRRQDGSRRNRYGLRAIDPWPEVEAPVILYGLMSVCAKKNSLGIRSSQSQTDIHKSSQLQTDKMFQRRASLAAVNDLYSFGQQRGQQYPDMPIESMDSRRGTNHQLMNQYTGGIRRSLNESDDDASSMPANYSMASQMFQGNAHQMGRNDMNSQQLQSNQMNYNQSSDNQMSNTHMNNYQMNSNRINTIGMRNSADYSDGNTWNQQTYDTRGFGNGNTVTLSTSQTHNLQNIGNNRQSICSSTRQSSSSLNDISDARSNAYNLSELHDTLRGHKGGNQFSPQMQSLSEYGTQPNNNQNGNFQRNSSAPQEYEKFWSAISQGDQFQRQDAYDIRSSTITQNNNNNNNYGLYEQQSMKRSGSEGQLYQGTQQRSTLRHQPYPGNKSYTGNMTTPTQLANGDDYTERLMNNDAATMQTRLQSLF